MIRRGAGKPLRSCALWKRRLFAVLMLVAASAWVHALPEEGARIIFDEAIYWAGKPRDVERVLDRVQRAGFNVYIPCVWHGQGALWPTDAVATWHRDPALVRRDPLADFVRRAHRRGIEVHPCFTLLLREREFYPEFLSGSGGRTNVFDVQNPQFRAFVTRWVLDVVRRYDIDGINLDYVRAGQVCYAPACVASYRQATGRELLADLKQRTQRASIDAHIVEWQRAAVTDLISGIAAGARALKPDITVSVDAAPWSESVVIEGQDSIQWLNDGVIDLLLTMNYQREIDWLQLDNLQSQVRRPSGFAVMIANYWRDDDQRLHSKSAAELVPLLQTAAHFNPAGHHAMYIYSMLTDSQIRGMSERKPANAPASRD